MSPKRERRRVLFEKIKSLADARVAVQVWLERVEDGDWGSFDALVIGQ